MDKQNLILGGGVTGLAAGIATKWPVYEAREEPGGICRSYYLDGFRFETGGGHWMFGCNGQTGRFLFKYAFVPRSYERKASVYFSEDTEYFPYPIQGNFDTRHQYVGPVVTMKEWLLAQFGSELCERFFFPFHEKYTAGLYDRLAPQDGHKSPVQGQGYNATFVYPPEGLDAMCKRMAVDCDVRYSKRVVAIDHHAREIHFSDGDVVQYGRVYSTLPLSHMIRWEGTEPDPSTGVMVLNIGAKKGPNCPTDHWLYIPDSKSGFYRVGFYSNVDSGFLPKGGDDLVSLYIETAYRDWPPETFLNPAVAELQDWEWIGEVKVADWTTVPVAYTWKWPGSTWQTEALAKLEECGIYQIGRYGRWKFQGIVESIKEGLACTPW